MYLLYGSKGSGSAAIEAALELCGAQWQLVPAASWEPGPGLDALRRANPLGMVPTLVLPDGSVLTESAAILIHLGDAHPGSDLLPPANGNARQLSQAGRERAQAIRGLVFIAANCYAAIGIIDYPERWCEAIDETTAERIRAGTRTRLHRNWELFADLFAARPYLAGADVGALDLLAAVVSKWSGARAHLATARPAFHETLQRIERHPRVAEVFARHWP
jgi:GST-like protein